MAHHWGWGKRMAKRGEERTDDIRTEWKKRRRRRRLVFWLGLTEDTSKNWIHMDCMRSMKQGIYVNKNFTSVSYTQPTSTKRCVQFPNSICHASCTAVLIYFRVDVFWCFIFYLYYIFSSTDFYLEFIFQDFEMILIISASGRFFFYSKRDPLLMFV